MKPIHKLNNGRGATLCHICSVIITIGLTEDLYCEKCKPKQETLKEASKIDATEKYGIGYYPDVEKAFIRGAKWQQERSYSEEDMKSAFKIGFSIGYGSPVNGLGSKDETCDVWFEQFKKK